MPPGEREDAKNGLYMMVFGLAFLLAVVIIYMGGKRFLASRSAQGVPAPSTVPMKAPEVETQYDQAPSMLPPVKLKRIEGKPRPMRRSMPPAIPQPPIGPDKG